MKAAGEIVRNWFGKIREKLMAIQADPRPVCMGYALGVFLATTPFIGLKVAIALVITYIVHWNKISCIIGVLHINILTGPLFYGLSFVIGRTVIGTHLAFNPSQLLSFKGFLALATGSADVFLSLLAGGMVLGVPLSVGAYFMARALLKKKPQPRMTVVKRPDRPRLFTLITGASTGLGKELAIACARRGMNLLLVALPDGNLELLCRDLEREFGIRARSFETDLTERSAIQGLAEQVLGDYRVNFLINNAGIGGSHAFETSAVDDIDNIILLNIRALSLLTRLMIPELKSHSQSYILNVSSMAAFSPIPFKTVYPASKAFVSNFSRSLSQELKGSSVRVSVVYPGPIATNPDVVRRIMKQGAAGQVGLLPASCIAAICLKSVRHHKEVIVPGIMNKLMLLVIRVVPAWIRLRFLSRVIRREICECGSLAA
jgi:uncharacterized protein